MILPDHLLKFKISNNLHYLLKIFSVHWQSSYVYISKGAKLGGANGAKTLPSCFFGLKVSKSCSFKVQKYLNLISCFNPRLAPLYISNVDYNVNR